MSHYVISYSRKDKQFVDELHKRVSDAGISMWIDRHNIPTHEYWGDEIDEAIKAAYGVIVVISPHSTRSHNVTYEWAYAMGLGEADQDKGRPGNKLIIPILLQEPDPSKNYEPGSDEKQTPIHPKLARIQAFTFTDPNDLPWDELISYLSSKVGKLRLSDRLRKMQKELDDSDPEVWGNAIKALERSEDQGANEVLGWW